MISSSSQEQKIMATEMETIEPNLVKKLQISNPTETKDCVKIYSIGGTENLKQKQENIIQQIENTHIQAFVEEQMAKFEPPYCENCPNRRADRVCVNMQCGKKYMQLICGKCHYDFHQDAQTKPEIDIEEYFTKLANFLNSQQHEKKKQSQTCIDIENLANVFNVILEIHEKLDSFKFKLTKEVESYQSPSEVHAILQNGIIKALTKCQLENIQEELDIIKKNITFNTNKFFWNDASKKFETFSKTIKELEKFTDTMTRTIAQSFIGGFPIDLSELNCLNCSNLSSFGFERQDAKTFQSKSKEGEIILTNGPGFQMQVFLDYKLDILKKYKLRFRFDSQPMQYVIVGVMPYSMVENQWMYNIPNQYFSKRFMNSIPTYECSRIIRGANLSICPQKDMKIEMRIDFAENYVDFSDYPDYKNVNAIHQNKRFSSNEPYVLAFAFNQQSQITLESLKEIFSIDKY